MMKAWQYSSTKGGLEKTLRLVKDVPIPKPDDTASQHIVKMQAVCLNPVDYKPAEAFSFMVSKPATPGIDFVGRIVTPARGSSLREGQLVFGVAATSPLAGGALREYATVPKATAVALPADVKPIDASTIGVAGLTAYQSILPYVKSGDRIFINGGSGGTGVFGIQLAKMVGCHVTTSCSTANVDLCTQLGADRVIDYKKGDVVDALVKLDKFDHVVDNVGSNNSIYWRSDEYTTQTAKFIAIAAEFNLSYFAFSTRARLWPSRSRPKYDSILADPRGDHLEALGRWMAEGKLKAVVDSEFGFEQVPDAFRRLKTGRSRGKIVVKVADEADRKDSGADEA